MTNPDAIARFNAMLDAHPNAPIQFPISTLPRMNLALTTLIDDDTMIS